MEKATGAIQVGWWGFAVSSQYPRLPNQTEHNPTYVKHTHAHTQGHKRVAIGDRHNMAFQSTTVARGRGVGVVVNTGRTTEIGRISAAIAGTHVRVSCFTH